MFLDERTRSLLEIDRVLDMLHPVTPFGQKCKKAMKPYKRGEEDALNLELERIFKIRELVDTQRSVFVDIRTNMRALKDIRKSVERSISGGVLSTVEFFELKNFAELIGAISRSQRQLHYIIPKKYRVLELGFLSELLDPERSGLKTFYIYDSYSDELTSIRQKKRELEREFDIKKRERIKSIQMSFGIELRSNGEITVSREQKNWVELLKLHEDFYISNETYINITFKLKPNEDMNTLSEMIESLKQKEAVEEAKILADLSMTLGERADEVLEAMDAVGEFDLLIAKAYHAIAIDGKLPEIAKNGIYKVESGVHPLVAESLKKKGKSYTPVSIELSSGVTLITGANMGGKTVTLKMVGLLQSMLQYGLFVSADFLAAPLCDFIYISAGDEQSIDLGLSSFGAEIERINAILRRSDEYGIILIDELARGTNPHEGFAISAAIIDYLIKRPAKTLITTHFDGLGRSGVKNLQVRGLRSVDVINIGDPERICDLMDYTLIEIDENSDVPKDAINISRLFGLPDEILDYAQMILNREGKK